MTALLLLVVPLLVSVLRRIKLVVFLPRLHVEELVGGVTPGLFNEDLTIEVSSLRRGGSRGERRGVQGGEGQGVGGENDSLRTGKPILNLIPSCFSS